MKSMDELKAQYLTPAKTTQRTAHEKGLIAAQSQARSNPLVNIGAEERALIEAMDIDKVNAALEKALEDYALIPMGVAGIAQRVGAEKYLAALEWHKGTLILRGAINAQREP